MNITYKILYNDAVAMTGGQPVDGTLTVPQIVRQVAAEGVERIVVVTDEPDKYRSETGLPCRRRPVRAPPASWTRCSASCANIRASRS